ncbi:uncharacterized protein ASPGLDRAFT_1306170 [Aspergillus glaucus CBS 516.65]|uniref:Uncharacterized protein n=1 Tax=Aspergillus glaucus CBS 516.65 TaxID=1160497 RepID=A0A1L9VQ23_ASPGL|nr:hypothetical protein ASPGLDRAFT_1306170 [Aspergillus glaucus CBS 516.65]OJJ86023.1 hypothetical protein ASPGLDRAFT_1306170 [Aspergillus glaucus CBS 516.65]
MPHTEDIVWYCNLKFLMTRGLQFKIFICCLSTPSTVALVYSGPGNYTKLPRTPWGRRMKRMAMCAGARDINAAVAFGYPMGRRRSRIFVLREHISVPIIWIRDPLRIIASLFSTLTRLLASRKTTT